MLDATFSCAPGEMLALIGPSGSGKSTVLRCIAGLHKASAGYISCGHQTWLDTDTNTIMPVEKRRVGMVFQNYALFPHKTVLENIQLAIRGLDRKVKRERALSWLDKTNMLGLEDRRPASLSGGQKQRVALARALAADPSVLLLDEPFSAVDQQTRRKLYRELAKLRTGLDIPMVLVTHDVHEMQQLADSVCLMHKGQTLQSGPVQQVINQPSSKLIAKLLGHQNLFSATVFRHEQDQSVYCVDGSELINGPLTTLPINTPVVLLISPNAISLQDTNTCENTLHGIVRDAVSLGDEWSLTVHLNTVTKSLRFRVPQFAVSDTTLSSGDSVAVQLRQNGIFVIAEP